MTAQNALPVRPEQGGRLSPAIQNAIALWADATTDPNTPRRHDLLRDKTQAVADFFAYTGQPPHLVTPLDVEAWRAELERRGLAAATIYAQTSRISSWYNWAMQEKTLQQEITQNPVSLARPKAPKAYQTERTQALSDEEVSALLRVVRAKADEGSVVGKRDYALLLLYFLTGMRRTEIIRLRWGDVKLNGTITLTTKVKGGEYVNREVGNESVRIALVDYLRSCGRWGNLAAEDPLWTRHDHAGKPGGPLTSHAFVKNLKRYARSAGIGDIHLHQTRHTFARMVSEDTGSLIETQDALGHKNLATTRVYVQRVGTKKDKHSARIAQRLGIGQEPEPEPAPAPPPVGTPERQRGEKQAAEERAGRLEATLRRVAEEADRRGESPHILLGRIDALIRQALEERFG